MYSTKELKTELQLLGGAASGSKDALVERLMMIRKALQKKKDGENEAADNVQTPKKNDDEKKEEGGDNEDKAQLRRAMAESYDLGRLHCIGIPNQWNSPEESMELERLINKKLDEKKKNNHSGASTNEKVDQEKKEEKEEKHDGGLDEKHFLCWSVRKQMRMDAATRFVDDFGGIGIHPHGSSSSSASSVSSPGASSDLFPTPPPLTPAPPSSSSSGVTVEMSGQGS